MKRTFPLIAVVLMANHLLAADSNPKEALLGASKSLAEQANYSWKTTVEAPGQPIGTIEGKAEKAGASMLTLARGDQSFEGILKGAKGVVKTDEGWMPLSEAAADGSGQSGGTRFVARILEHFKAPPVEVTDVAGQLTDLKVAEGVYSGALPEAAVKELLLYRTPPGANSELRGAKGSAKFWIKDGALAKYEFNLEGTLTVNGNERELNRTHTTEIKEVGATKVSVPEEATKKL